MNKNQRLHEHLSFAYQNSSAVRALFDSHGLTPQDIKTVEDLSKLPVTSKDSMIEQQQANPPFGGWNAVPIGDLEAIYLSPGPLYDTHEASTTDNSAETLRLSGFEPGDIVINGFLYHMVPAGMLFHEGLVKAGITVVPLGPGNTEVHVKAMLDLGANGFVGTPSFLSIILDKAESMGVPKKAIPIKKASFSAEPYPASLRQKFENEYGMTTSQSYATADFGVIAYQLPGEYDFALRDDLVVELADPATGEVVPEGTPGEVVVTCFSKVLPLIRYGTGDMAVMTPGTGRLFALVGRSGDAVKVRGMFLHPNQINFVMPQLPGVQAWQAFVSRQDNRDRLTLEMVVTKADLDPEHVKNAIKQVARLTVDEVIFVKEVDVPGKVSDVRDWN